MGGVRLRRHRDPARHGRAAAAARPGGSAPRLGVRGRHAGGQRRRPRAAFQFPGAAGPFARRDDGHPGVRGARPPCRGAGSRPRSCRRSDARHLDAARGRRRGHRDRGRHPTRRVAELRPRDRGFYRLRLGSAVSRLLGGAGQALGPGRGQPAAAPARGGWPGAPGRPVDAAAPRLAAPRVPFRPPRARFCCCLCPPVRRARAAETAGEAAVGCPGAAAHRHGARRGGRRLPALQQSDLRPPPGPCRRCAGGRHRGRRPRTGDREAWPAHPRRGAPGRGGSGPRGGGQLRLREASPCRRGAGRAHGRGRPGAGLGERSSRKAVRRRPGRALRRGRARIRRVAFRRRRGPHPFHLERLFLGAARRLPRAGRQGARGGHGPARIAPHAAA